MSNSFSAQTTPSEVEGRLDELLDRLQAETLPAAPTNVAAVHGGVLQSQARGAAVISPNTEQATEESFFMRSVRVEYENLPDGRVLTETSPARLIRIGGRWRESGLEGRWRTEHDFTLGPAQNTLVYQVPRGEELVALPPRPHEGIPDIRARYEIPPAATKLRGQGRVKLRTGQTYEIGGEGLLKRPLADGTLGIRRGGVYGVFESERTTAQHHPQALIGTQWIPLTPIDEAE